MRSNFTTLLIMPRQRRLPMLEHLEGCGVDFLLACDCQEARHVLESRRVQVVLTAVSLPDGDWRNVLDAIEQEHLHTEVIVCAPAPTKALCAEVFARGAYDLVVVPCAADELLHVLQAASARAYMRSLRGAPARQMAAAL